MMTADHVHTKRLAAGPQKEIKVLLFSPMVQNIFAVLTPILAKEAEQGDQHPSGQTE
jgi:hypothetical protein